MSIKPKKAGVLIWSPLPCGFSRNVFSRERLRPCFFLWTTYFIENFIEIPLVIQKIFSVNISYFNWFFGFFWDFLVGKKLMTSAYNRWCQHFQPTINLLWIDYFNNCVNLFWYWISCSWNLKVGTHWSLSRKNYVQKAQSY